MIIHNYMCVCRAIRVLSGYIIYIYFLGVGGAGGGSMGAVLL